MNSKSLAAFAERFRDHGPMSLLHKFSDSGLHTALLIAVVLIAAVALVKAVTLTVQMWTLEPVVIHGQSKTTPPPAPQPPTPQR